MKAAAEYCDSFSEKQHSVIKFVCWIVQTQPFEGVDDFFATLKYLQHYQNDITHLLADIGNLHFMQSETTSTQKFFRDY